MWYQIHSLARLARCVRAHGIWSRCGRGGLEHLRLSSRRPRYGWSSLAFGGSLGGGLEHVSFWCGWILSSKKK